MQLWSRKSIESSCSCSFHREEIARLKILETSLFVTNQKSTKTKGTGPFKMPFIILLSASVSLPHWTTLVNCDINYSDLYSANVFVHYSDRRRHSSSVSFQALIYVVNSHDGDNYRKNTSMKVIRNTFATYFTSCVVVTLENSSSAFDHPRNLMPPRLELMKCWWTFWVSQAFKLKIDDFFFCFCLKH